MRVGGDEQCRKGTKMPSIFKTPTRDRFPTLSVPKKVQTSNQKNEVCACECKYTFRRDNVIAITGLEWEKKKNAVLQVYRFDVWSRTACDTYISWGLNLWMRAQRAMPLFQEDVKSVMVTFL